MPKGVSASGRPVHRRRPSTALAPDAIGVKEISTADLIPNPHNPRMLFDRAPMDVLRTSIGKVGILVPLTVYWDQHRERYVILDGQRRWMTAQELGIRTVPVNQVAEPTLAQNIVTMFQIHKVREDWELMPTALKLEVLMSELKERRDANLAVLTGLDQAVVTRCKKLLSYPRRFQDLMLDPDPKSRVKADFFIELYPVLTDRLVATLPWFRRDTFTKAMLKKYLEAKALRSVTDFRIVKQYVNNARKANKSGEISRRLHEFADEPTLKIDHLHIHSADVTATARKITAAVTALYDTIYGLDVDEYFGEEELWSELERLLRAIKKKLAAVGRRPAT